MKSKTNPDQYATITDAYTIFYVDDDEDDRFIFEETVARIAPGTNLKMFKNGIELIRAVFNPPPIPAIIFVDLNLPGINGFEVIERIKQTPEFAQLPLIVISTSYSENSFSRSKELGVSYYIVKSANEEGLKQSLYKALTTDWQKDNLSNNEFAFQSK